ncbi:Putative ribonuclease H protein At1g65750 [Linum perenne]
MDLATSEGARARYARVCVEIDLSKPLLGKYMIGDRGFYIEYESIENFCYLCGLYGYKAISCPSCRPAAIPSEPPMVQKPDKVCGSEERDTGSWMVVSRKQKKKSVVPKNTQPEPTVNKFGILENLPDNGSGQTGSHASTPKLTKNQGAKAVHSDPKQNAQVNARTDTESVINWPPIPRAPLGDVTNAAAPSAGVFRPAGSQDSSVPALTEGLVQVPITYENQVFDSKLPGSIISKAKSNSKGKAKPAKVSNARTEKNKSANVDRPKVSSFVLESGEWDVDSFRSFLPAEAILQITSVLPPARGRGDDTWNWGEEPDGKFSIRSAYSLILELDSQTSDPDWKCIWRWRGPSRVQHFLWLAMHNKLLTNSERKRRHLTDLSSCPRCNVQEETVSHILRECSYATAVWNQLGLQEFCSTQENLCSWLSAGLVHQKSLIFGIGCWFLWKARNEWVFSANPQSSADLAARISSWKRTVELALSQDSILGSKPISRRNIDIAWDPGPEDWITVNTDISVINQSGNASAGGLIRDHLGHCFLAFSANIGKCSITRAELRGILHGLELTWSSGYKKVRLQTDSQSAARLILAEDPPTHQHASEVLAIRELLHRNWQVEIHHIFREGNGAADFLANMGHGFDPGIHMISSSDCNLGYFLRKDCMQIAELRSIPIMN